MRKQKFSACSHLAEASTNICHVLFCTLYELSDVWSLVGSNLEPFRLYAFSSSLIKTNPGQLKLFFDSDKLDEQVFGDHWHLTEH